MSQPLTKVGVIFGGKSSEHSVSIQSAKTIVNESSELRECQTIHSAELNKIFFETLDELDCKRSDPTILR